MNIAIIGWGSLIWCLGSLRIKTRWRKDGPPLPLEFARVSEDGRLTLVIHANSTPQQTYWAVSELTEIGDARRNLQEREGVRFAKIHFLPGDDSGEAIQYGIAATLQTWLQKHKDIDSVLWTGLTTNWDERFGREFSPEEAVGYLEKLDTERKQARLKYERAREYVRNAPPLIQTEVRAKMREKRWTDAKLSDVLFEADTKV